MENIQVIMKKGRIAMIYSVWDIEEGKLYLFTSREKAEKCVRYLDYFDTGNSVGARIEETDENTIDVIPDITTQKITAGTSIMVPEDEKPIIDDIAQICIYLASNDKNVGDVDFSFEDKCVGSWTNYFLEKVYQVQEGESVEDFHKRILEDMNKELKQRIKCQQKV